MGFVWNVMLSFDNEEYWQDGEDEARETCAPLEQINAWLSPNRLVSLVGPTFEKGVGFGIDANLYGGGFKHLDIENFIEIVVSQDWKKRTKVQFWVKGAEEGMGNEPWTLVKLRGRRRQPALKGSVTRRQHGIGTKADRTRNRRPPGSR